MYISNVTQGPNSAMVNAMKKHQLKHKKKKFSLRGALPRNVEESNSIGVRAGDATSGVSKTPQEWAEQQGIDDEPTFALEPGDPSPLQPAASSPHADDDKSRRGRARSARDPAGVPRERVKPATRPQHLRLGGCGSAAHSIW